jgi:protein SCO1/2
MPADSPMRRSGTVLVVLVLVVAAGAGAWLARTTLQREPGVDLLHATALNPPQPLPDFSLLAENGQPIARADVQGHWSLVFFGFTHCPDVCPTTLAKLADVRRRVADLPEEQQPRVVLVSVDPERDTPPVLKEYLEGFDPSLRGITGSVEGIDAFASALGVAHSKIPMGGDQYMVDHTSVVMVIDPLGRRAAIFSPPLEPAAIADDYRRLVTGRRVTGSRPG